MEKSSSEKIKQETLSFFQMYKMGAQKKQINWQHRIFCFSKMSSTIIDSQIEEKINELVEMVKIARMNAIELNIMDLNNDEKAWLMMAIAKCHNMYPNLPAVVLLA